MSGIFERFLAYWKVLPGMPLGLIPVSLWKQLLLPRIPGHLCPIEKKKGGGNYESVKIVSVFEASFNLSGGKPHVSLA